MQELVEEFSLKDGALSDLTSAVQFGFILGTLIFAFLNIADRFSPSKVFFFSAVLGALTNVSSALEFNDFHTLLASRFLTGFFLAGIYPVGMKIASDYFDKGLGKSLGFLVGALVLGTAFPHLLKDMKGALPWEFVIYGTSALAFSGGIFMMIFVKDGPKRKVGSRLKISATLAIFKIADFRKAAFGYFGHMWELYTFWALVPVILTYFEEHGGASNLNIPLLSFCIIAIGSVSCIFGGFLSGWIGTRKSAIIFLSTSCICCLISPFVIDQASTGLFLLFLFVWGFSVIADSPLFSTLVAQGAPSEIKGTALTIVNSIGFAITIMSIQLISELYHQNQSSYTIALLSLGPALGLFAMRNK
jgi:MFS family permease